MLRRLFVLLFLAAILFTPRVNAFNLGYHAAPFPPGVRASLAISPHHVGAPVLFGLEGVADAAEDMGVDPAHVAEKVAAVSLPAFDPAAFAARLASYWPLLLFLLPSLITALTPYPKAGGVVKVLSFVLNLGSVLVHKDSPGTLKAPLVQSQDPETMQGRLS